MSITGRQVVTANVQYYEVFAKDYSLFFADLEANMEQEGSWLDGLLRCEGVVTVLDAGCGAGRHAIPLARRGYRVTGVDPSPAMLQEARLRMRAGGIALSLQEAGFLDLPHTVAEQFDAVLVLGNSLCNQERRDDILASLLALRRCCRPGGPCLIGIKDFDAIRRQRRRVHGHRARHTGRERAILFEIWEYADPLLLCTAHAIHGCGGIWSVHSAQTREYMLGAEELRCLAREAGFTRIERLSHPAEAMYLLRP